MENNSLNGEISAAGSGEVEYATVVKNVAGADNTANDTDNKNLELDAENGVKPTEDVNDDEDQTAADDDAEEKSDSVNTDDVAVVADNAEPDNGVAAGDDKPDEPPEEDVQFSAMQQVEADYTEIAEVQDIAEHSSKADEDVPPPPPPDSEPPSEDPPSYHDVQNDDEQAHEPEREPSPELEREPSPVPVISKPQHNFHPRKCHIRKWPDFQGYGFNLHAEKDKKGQYIGLVDANSPAEDADLRKGDRIIEVNGENIEDVAHAQVIQKIKAGGDETILLVVDPEADEFYKNNGIKVTADLPEVIANETRRKDSTPDATTQGKTYIPRECHIIKWPDFPGYGFNLHAEKERGTQYIGKIDPNSPAEDAGLCEHDRIIEVNGVNIENETHQQVIARIKAGGDETRLLVVDKEADAHYKSKGITVTSKMPEVKFLQTTRRSPRSGAVTNGDSKPAANSAAAKQTQPTKVEPAKSEPAQANGGDLLSMNLSAKEMRERLASKKKNDPKTKANMDFKSKFEIFQKM